MTIKGLKFLLTCYMCPEQYDVLDENGCIVGYVRLRHGYLSCDFPHCGGFTIYGADIGGEYTGRFENVTQRMYHLNVIADRILEIIKGERI